MWNVRVSRLLSFVSSIFCFEPSISRLSDFVKFVKRTEPDFRLCGIFLLVFVVLALGNINRTFSCHFIAFQVLVVGGHLID